MADTDPAKQHEEPSAPRWVHDISEHHNRIEHEDQPIKINIKFAPEDDNATLYYEDTDTLDNLIFTFMDEYKDYDWHKAKVLLTSRGPPGAPKPPKTLLHSETDGDVPLAPYHGTTLKILAQKWSTLLTLQDESYAASRREEILAYRKSRIGKQHKQASARGSKRPTPQAQEDAAFTFHTLQPLQYLPDPSRSLAFLQRLKDDAGIRAAMRKHKFSVGLLTEMDPAAYTESNHEGTTRILGLNRNQGEVIELRLRTDAGDGYRDYKTIRKTLCHELAHNVHGPHDRNFWDLCHLIEREVDKADWKSGGRTVGDQEFAPERPGQEDEEEEVMDHGAWTGGSYVLGGSAMSGAVNGQPAAPLTRREILARAAEARRKQMENAHAQGSSGRNTSAPGGGQGSASR